MVITSDSPLSVATYAFCISLPNLSYVRRHSSSPARQINRCLIWERRTRWYLGLPRVLLMAASVSYPTIASPSRRLGSGFGSLFMKSSLFDTIPPVRACPQLLVQIDSKVRLAELCGSRMAQVLVGSTVAGNALWRARVHYQPQMESRHWFEDFATNFRNTHSDQPCRKPWTRRFRCLTSPHKSASACNHSYAFIGASLWHC
jgi:hypothetical protein